MVFRGVCGVWCVDEWMNGWMDGWMDMLDGGARAQSEGQSVLY